MKRFSQVEYDEASSTALVGAGLTWDEVYDVLDPIDVSVVGGRASGVRLSNSDTQPQLTILFVGWCCRFYPWRW
jgi:hypothetical protein